MAFGRSKAVYILHYTKVLDPTQEKLDLSVSLPDTATRAELDEAMNRMAYVGDMRVERINKIVEEEKKKAAEVSHGETEKNAANREAIKDSAKKAN